MSWSSDDERAAREAAARVCMSDWHPAAMFGMAVGNCPSCDAIVAAIRTAREAARAEGERGALERVAGVLRRYRKAQTDLYGTSKEARQRSHASNEIEDRLAYGFGAAWPDKKTP